MEYASFTSSRNRFVSSSWVLMSALTLSIDCLNPALPSCSAITRSTSSLSCSPWFFMYSSASTLVMPVGSALSCGNSACAYSEPAMCVAKSDTGIAMSVPFWACSCKLASDGTVSITCWMFAPAAVSVSSSVLGSMYSVLTGPCCSFSTACMKVAKVCTSRWRTTSAPAKSLSLPSISNILLALAALSSFRCTPPSAALNVPPVKPPTKKPAAIASPTPCVRLWPRFMLSLIA